MNITKDHSFTIPLTGLPLNAELLHMVWIKPGTFVMGSPKEEPGRSEQTEDQFLVTLNHGFWLGQYTVTQAQWNVVMNDGQCQDQNNLNYPIGNIDWDEATLFCESLNKIYKSKLFSTYTFGLPTEAQWEYACRAGTQSAFYNGDDPNQLSEIAWCKENSKDRVHQVGKKQPNGWGLYDMLGNAFEWCYDSSADYPDHHVQDWYEKQKHIGRSIRGGTFGSSRKGGLLRCALRGYGSYDTKASHLGFRLCLRTLATPRTSMNHIG